MSITVHFHAAAGTGLQAVSHGSGGMDGGASLPAVGAADARGGMDHVDAPAAAIDAGGPPAGLVSAVEAALARSGDTGARGGDNDGGAAPQ